MYETLPHVKAKNIVKIYEAKVSAYRLKELLFKHFNIDPKEAYNFVMEQDVDNDGNPTDPNMFTLTWNTSKKAED